LKIIAIRFTNLNSLAGNWEIDLNTPEYTGSGIFAIVGATGSGKSTILDAVSLALYGRTPRLKQISKSANDLMTHHTGECSAELEFVSARGHFRCFWSQHRARRHPAGDLQQPRHEIVDARTGKVLETKIKEVARKVVEVTGMDFDQFTRSMLLAQGEFNKFLQASADERAPILEQITGTEIYSNISRQVHELTNNSRQLLEQLKRELTGFNLLSQDEEGDITTELQELSSTVSSLQKDIERLRTEREWHNTLTKLSSSCESLAKELETLAAEHKIFAPEKARLDRGKAAARIADHYDRIEELKKQQQQDKQTLAATELEIKGVNTELLKCRENSAILQQSRHKAGDDFKTAQPLLLEVVQLDQQQTRLSKDMAEQSRLLQTNQQSSAAKDRESQKLQQLLAEIMKEAQRAEQYLTEHVEDSKLLEDMSGLRIIFTSLLATKKKTEQLQPQYQQTLATLSRLQKELPTLQKVQAESARKLDEQQKQMRGIQQQLDNTPSQNELFTARQQLLEQMNEVQALRQVASELTALRTKQKNIHNQLEARTEEYEKFTVQLQQKTKELTSYQTLVEREEEIVLLSAKVKNFGQERQLLQHGTPCPLCGSPTHPFIDDDIPAQMVNPHERLRKAKETAAECAGDKQKLQNSLTRLDLENARDREALDDLGNNLHQGEQRLATALGDVDSEQDIGQTLSGRLHELQRLLSTKGEEIKKREDQEKALHLERQLQEKTDKALRQQERATETTLQNIVAANKDAAQQKFELDKSLHEFAETLHELQQRFPELAAEQEPSPGDLQTLLNTLEERARHYTGAKAKFEKYSNDQQQMQTTLQHLRQTLTELHSARTETEKKKTQLHEELETTREKRNQLFGDKIVAEEMRRLEEQVEKTEAALQQHNQHLSVLERNLATLHERRKLTGDNIEGCAGKIHNSQVQFNNLLAASEFADEEIFLSSRLTSEELTELERRAEQLADRTTASTTLYNNTKTELAKEQERQLTEHPLPEVDRQIAETNSHLAEKLQQTGALQKTLEEHRKALLKYHDKQQQLASFEKDYNYWCQLHNLIGSADGKKFRNFAQGITFELMIRQANQQLIKMNDRYILMRNTISPLDLQVVDNYQGGELRTTANLSGGESFIVSLALALGLASMAGKNIRVDTLFLDEGFGTLDEEALDVALDTLSSMHQDGKLIGIISHVHLLRERIATQINLAAGSNGRSTISGPGVKRLP